MEERRKSAEGQRKWCGKNNEIELIQVTEYDEIGNYCNSSSIHIIIIHKKNDFSRNQIDSIANFQ